MPASAAPNSAIFAQKHPELVFLLLFSFTSQYSLATDLVWDADGITGEPRGGAGIWDRTSTRWFDGTANRVWDNEAGVALFQAPQGVVSLAEPMTAAGLRFNSPVYTIDGAEHPLTIRDSGHITVDYTTNSSIQLLATVRGSGLRLNPKQGNTLTANPSEGQMFLRKSLLNEGPLHIEGGLVVASTSVDLSTSDSLHVSGPGLYHPRALLPSTETNQFSWLKQGILELIGSGSPLGSKTLNLYNGSLVYSSNTAGSDLLTLERVALKEGFNAIVASPRDAAPHGDILRIRHLERSADATLQVRSAFGVLGANGNNGKIAIDTLDGQTPSNASGIVGGWACTHRNGAGVPSNGPSDVFVTWDAQAQSLKMARMDKASGMSAAAGEVARLNQSLSAALPADNWLANGVVGNNTITTDVTINSLIQESDVLVNNGARLVLNSGGYIFRRLNSWLQSSTNNGRLTTGDPLGRLYINVAATMDSLPNMRARLKIEDNGSVRTRLVKTGGGSLRIGTYNNGSSTANSYTGGTQIQSGRLLADSTNCFGTGDVEILAGGQAYLVSSGLYRNNFRIQGRGIPEAAGVLGAIRFDTNAVVTGNVQLVGHARMHVHLSTEFGTVRGIISGGYDLEKTGAGTLLLTGANDYTGTTLVRQGTLLGSGSNHSSHFMVNTGATISPGSGSSNRVSLGLGGLELMEGSRVVFDLGTTPEQVAGTNDHFDVRGDLVLPLVGNADIRINAVGGTLGNGRYRLVDYSGRRIGGGTGNLVLKGYGGTPEQSLSLDFGTPNVLYLNVSDKAYGVWAASQSLIGDDAAEMADPDDDGAANLLEFALNGNPHSGTLPFNASGTLLPGNPAKSFVLSFPTRSGAIFTADGFNQTAHVDGLVYLIEGSRDLAVWGDLQVSEIIGADAADAQAGLPALDPGWEYHSFTGEATGPGSLYLRVGVSREE
jgi:autotransporter-associated beta strand protein